MDDIIGLTIALIFFIAFFIGSFFAIKAIIKCIGQEYRKSKYPPNNQYQNNQYKQ